MPEEFDVVVVGAGQAGLALGYYLKQRGARFLILERATELGESWRKRWDSLTLFTPAEYDGLPGLPFPRNPDSYPGKDEVAGYLERYAQQFELPIRLNTPAVALERREGRYRIETGTEEIEAEQVVIATGPFQRPHLPPFSRALDSAVTQLHSSGYRNPDSLPEGEVLVVGGGNSGWQIAEELATSRTTVLSSRPLPRVPRRLLGKSLFWWLQLAGLTKVAAHTSLGKRMSSNDDVVIGDRPDSLLRSGRLRLAPRAVSAAGEQIDFEDGSSIEVRNVVWATGYRSDYSWVGLPIFDEEGRPIHHRGVTEAPGLYFLGLRWQHTTGSALLGWVAHDARFIAAEIDRLSSDE